MLNYFRSAEGRPAKQCEWLGYSCLHFLSSFNYQTEFTGVKKGGTGVLTLLLRSQNARIGKIAGRSFVNATVVLEINDSGKTIEYTSLFALHFFDMSIFYLSKNSRLPTYAPPIKNLCHAIGRYADLSHF